MRASIACGLSILAISAAKAQMPVDSVGLTADPRAQAATANAMRCTVQRGADYINAGSKESAEVLGRSAVQYCFDLWKIAAAVRAKIGPEYGIDLNSLEHLQIIEDSYLKDIASTIVELRMSHKINR